VDKVPVPACPGIRLTAGIDHIALPEKMVRRSSSQLRQEKTEQPDSYFEAYREWQRQKNPYVRTDETVWDVIRTELQLAPTCNFTPDEAMLEPKMLRDS